MGLLEKQTCISVNQGSNSCAELELAFRQISVETKSVTGFEIVSFVTPLVELIVAIVSMPILLEAINDHRITVTIDGFKFNDSVSRIIKAINSDPELLERATQEYLDHTLSVEGNAKSSLEFRKRLQTLIDAQMEGK